jgi:uncharacterized protein YjbJ (UPF0337 family)
MTEKVTKGAKQQASGSIKEALGKITGDDAMAAEGRSDKASGKVASAEQRSKKASKK